jgi:hypothetical protein
VNRPEPELVSHTTKDGKKFVKSGPVTKLVELLVDPDDSDVFYTQTFLLTHKQFIDSRTLLQNLIQLFRSRSSHKSNIVDPKSQRCYF